MAGRRRQTRFIVPAVVQGNLRIHERNLVIELPVTLIELSGEGCLVESPLEVAPQVEGDLNLRIDGRISHDRVRIVRCHPGSDAMRAYRIAATFIGDVSRRDSLRSTNHSKQGAQT